MITVEKAIQEIKTHVRRGDKISVLMVENAGGYVLAEDVISPINMPPFRQSAMDGYALNLNGGIKYNITDEVKAGDDNQPILKPGEAVRIFTGAPVPDTANAIIIQEHVSVIDGKLHVEKPVVENANIRPRGEQITSGEIAMTRGTLLTPAGIGFLATLGVTQVKVIDKPKIGILVTGNELVQPGEELLFGQIYESNACMLNTQLKKMGFDDVVVKKVGDNYERTLHVLKSALDDFDLVILSGGISVGDYDFVRDALVELEVEQIFYKVKQKPGKPMFFGKTDNSYVFALPGNPASALSCFYVYVYRAIQLLIGNERGELNKVKAKLKNNYVKKGDRAQFLKAIYANNEIGILDGQQSSMLHTFALANALAFVPETASEIEAGELLDVVLLPVN
jgi:molybdopterin molybdotransferase